MHLLAQLEIWKEGKKSVPLQANIQKYISLHSHLPWESSLVTVCLPYLKMLFSVIKCPQLFKSMYVLKSEKTITTVGMTALAELPPYSLPTSHCRLIPSPTWHYTHRTPLAGRPCTSVFWRSVILIHMKLKAPHYIRLLLLRSAVPNFFRF